MQTKVRIKDGRVGVILNTYNYGFALVQLQKYKECFFRDQYEVIEDINMIDLDDIKLA